MDFEEQLKYTAKGSLVALVTPFTSNGDVDFIALKRLIEWHIDEGTNGFVILGSTGEAATLSTEEWLSVIAYSIEIIQGRVPIIVGAGSNSTSDTISKIALLSEYQIDAVLVVVPYYNKPSQEGIYQHFKAIAKSTNKNIILYNVPSRTVCSISVDTTLRLARELKNIVGIKEASGCMIAMTDLIAGKPNGFMVYSGDDSTAYSSVCLGGDGCISVVANIIPQQFAALMQSAMDGNRQKALDILFKYKDLMKLMMLETNPQPVKAALALQGVINDAYRLPLVSLGKENLLILKTELERLSLL